MQRLNGMQQLQQLDLAGSGKELLVALVALVAEVEQIFSAVPQLKGLTLHSGVSSEAFDALLQHATQLTRLTCYTLHLWQDRSHSPCNWKELVVTSYCHAPRLLAYLPLNSLSRVSLGPKDTPYNFEIPSACPCLTFQKAGCSPPEMATVFTKLGTCPAWQASGPSVLVCLEAFLQQTDVQYWQLTIPILAALANRKVRLSISALGLRGDIVEHLGATLGHSLTHLTLAVCSIPHDFWPAVWRHLPGLQEPSLWSHVRGAVSRNDIAAFCSHATRLLRILLGWRLYSSVGPAEQLEQQCRTWGVPQVTVVEDDIDHH
jgi:hypothetical protein